ncbi:hypothetical protein HDU85_001481 [Gaertneriomyces sp. JEL0708]|nr:hypothetical protein HDU85_001481 [Gaertneriomyces sp. JEL0708]
MFSGEKRREELEKKRAKLAEIRRQKEERRVALGELQKGSVDRSIRNGSRDWKDVDELVTSLVGDRGSTQYLRHGESSATVASDAYASRLPREEQSTPSLLDNTGGGGGLASASKSEPTLTSVEFVFLDLVPKERVTYTKEVQTETLDIDEEPVVLPVVPLHMGTPAEVPTSMTTKSEDVANSHDSLVNLESFTEERDLTEDERGAIVMSDDFLTFFDRSTKLVERALNDKHYDFLIDYSADESGTTAEEGGSVKLACNFFDERWSKGRLVADIQWSQRYPELLLGAYGKNHAGFADPDGVVLIWNTHLLGRPEFVFHTQSEVTSAVFSPFHSNLVIGGTYSGQIVIWDTRAKSLPVLRTPLSAAGHTHPVYSMSIAGTQNAHNLITASTDGLMCSWQLDMLAQPQETLDLVYPDSHGISKNEGASVTALAFPCGETTSFWVGTEAGTIHHGNRYDRAGSKAGINPTDMYRGHTAMITGMSFHPMAGSADFTDLFLTSSVDWTVKLWKAKSATKAAAASVQEVITPLYSFEGADDYVCDVKWSPVHPSVFGCVDASGRVDVYDLNQDVEVPISSISVGSGKSLNKLAWDKEGRKTAVGASDGYIYVYDLGDISQPKPDEWNAFQRTLTDLSR